MRTTVVLDDALFQEATKAVLETWLAKSEPPPRRWKTLVIEEGLNALLADANLSRTLRDAPVGTAEEPDDHRRRGPAPARRRRGRQGAGARAREDPDGWAR